MPLRLRSALGAAGAIAAAAVLLSGCEQLVYEKTPFFNPPPDSANGFLGYFDVSTQQTTCGQCHSGKQEEWSGTKHSHAWADLQASGHASESCEPCHTVNQNGNWVTAAAGFNVTPDSAYHDVQCESCHGPGADHIKSAESVKPLASIAADTGLTNGCGECHSGSHNPFVEEWSASPHGYASEYLAEGTRDPCQNCHEGRRALGVTLAGQDPRPSGQIAEPGVYTEADTGPIQPITCAVCHDPHDATNPGQLRQPVGTTDTTQLCYRCHHREAAPESGSAPRRGPHGAQGAIVLDEEAGWIPPNWTFGEERILPTHSTNDRGCAACHVTPYSNKDASGTTHYYVGHSFAAIPCVDQTTGMPMPDSTCADTQRYFAGCAVSGCHGSAEAARSAYEVLEARMDYLTDQLWSDTNKNGIMETTDGGLLPKVLAQENAAGHLDVMNLYDTTLTAAEGAIWNAQLAATDNRSYWFSFKIAGQNSCDPNSTSSSTKCPSTGRSNTGHRSSGGGVHNPFFLEALLTQTITAIENQYGVSPSAPIDLTPHMAPPPGLKAAKR